MTTHSVVPSNSPVVVIAMTSTHRWTHIFFCKLLITDVSKFRIDVKWLEFVIRKKRILVHEPWKYVFKVIHDRMCDSDEVLLGAILVRRMRNIP